MNNFRFVILKGKECFKASKGSILLVQTPGGGGFGKASSIDSVNIQQQKTEQRKVQVMTGSNYRFNQIQMGC